MNKYKEGIAKVLNKIINDESKAIINVCQHIIQDCTYNICDQSIHKIFEFQIINKNNFPFKFLKESSKIENDIKLYCDNSLSYKNIIYLRNKIIVILDIHKIE